MTFHVECEVQVDFPFSLQEVVERVAQAVLDTQDCPYETEINVLLTDNAGIRVYNREYRQVDRETDVLSFPNIPFETPADFSVADRYVTDCFHPESGELILGDIILSVDKVCEQASAYGHSRLREFAFLVAHSMLHLCGYDHETPKDAQQMEALQQKILDQLGITRDIGETG